MQPGMNVGSYRIIEQIGKGGMATIFKAYDPGMERYVAIKIVSPQFAQHPEFQERFRREAKSIAKLEHPHIIPVFAYGEEGETAYLVLRYMDTGTLRDQMNHTPMDFQKARLLIDQIGGALDYAHRNGVIHRDVKPSNVLIDSDGNAYLTDFGIAKIVEATVELTGTGTAMGTPQYMSPEQCRGDKDLASATDTYSLGVILYQMVTGTLPFDAETPLAVIHQHLNDPLPPPRTINPQVTEGMERVLFKALAKDPEDRFASTSDLTQAFSAAVSKLKTVAVPVEPVEPKPSAIVEQAPADVQPKTARRLPPWAWTIGGVLLAVIVVGGLLATGTIELPSATEPSTATSLPVVEAEPPTPRPSTIDVGIAELNPAPDVVEDPIPFGEHFYSITREQIPWDEAVRLAQNLGGYLVSISHPQENDFVHQNFRRDIPEDSVWLGLSDTRQEGEFEWHSGDPLTYTNWDEGQPDHFGIGKVCTHMYPSGRWDDIPCEEDAWFFAVVEFERLPSGTGALTGMAMDEFVIEAFPETSQTFPAGTEHDGFVSQSDDPMAPWTGTSVHFRGTLEGGSPEMLGEASLVYRYRLQFEEVTALNSVAVSGAAFNAPDNILRVLDEDMNVLGSVETFGENSFLTHYVILEGVEGEVFFIEEFDTSQSWRYRESIIVNGLVIPFPETSQTFPTGTEYDGFVSQSDDPMAPWAGSSVHFRGTEDGGSSEMLGEASLVYRYRLQFEDVTALNSVAVSGAAFNGPDSVLRVLDEDMNVLGSVETFGGNSFLTHYVILEGVEGEVFFIEEYDTSHNFRYRENIVVNGPLP